MRWYEYFLTIGGMMIVCLGIGIGVYANFVTKVAYPTWSGFIGVGITILFVLVAMAAFIETARSRGSS